MEELTPCQAACSKPGEAQEAVTSEHHHRCFMQYDRCLAVLVIEELTTRQQAAASKQRRSSNSRPTCAVHDGSRSSG